MTRCPSCERDDFDTKRAMHIHHEAAHDESLAKSKKECPNCNQIFTYYPNYRERIHCRECVKNGHSETPALFGESNPKWDGGFIVECECDWCGESVNRSRERADNCGYIACSPDCQSELQSLAIQGEDNPRWKGGVDEDVIYSGNWWSARREAHERDNEECQICGDGTEELGQKPDAHHIIPARSFQDKQKAHYSKNLISLCRDCHSKVENDKIPLPISVLIDKGLEIPDEYREILYEESIQSSLSQEWDIENTAKEVFSD